MTKKTWVTISLMAIPAPYAAYAMDAFDAQLHSAVTQKIQQDHAADVRAGRVASAGSHGANTASTTSATASTGNSANAAPAVHPNQVQDLKRKHHRPPNTPPPNTHSGLHHLQTMR